MDPVSLAATLTTFLAPLLPYLLKGGEKAAEEVGKKFGRAAWDKATALWARLWPRLEPKPAAQEAIQEVAQAPEDQAAQGALNLQLRKILMEDSNLAQEVARWLEEARRAAVNIAVASGERSVAFVGPVTGSTIITGDDNK
jgi:predicted phosphoadenosine phosphosulfate sulfurtransferase